MHPQKRKIVNSKAMAALASKLAAQIERERRQEELEAREMEDEYWRQAGEGTKSRAAKKREEKAKKQEAAAARKAENRLLAKLEEETLEKTDEELCGLCMSIC